MVIRYRTSIHCETDLDVLMCDSCGEKMNSWNRVHTISLLFTLILIIVIGWLIPIEFRLWSWIFTLVILTISFLVVSYGVTGRWGGLLINSTRNKMSLSQFQMVIWTILVLSALFVAVVANIKVGDEDPLSIGIPEELWLLMGVSITSLVGTPIILKIKERQNLPEQTEVDNTIRQIAEQEGVPEAVLRDNVEPRGVLLVNREPSQARFSDIFMGEEVGNAASADLGKVQMFYFTIMLLLAYAVTLGQEFAGTNSIAALPALSAGMVALMGISHVGYLAKKAS